MASGVRWAPILLRTGSSLAQKTLRAPPLARTLFNMASSAAASKLRDASLFKQQAYVNGQWISAPSGATFTVEDPATGDTIGSCPDQSVEDTRSAVRAAKDAFPAWSQTTPKHRHDTLLKLHRLCQENAEDLAALITLENGKAALDAKGEVAYSASFLEWFAEEAVRTYGDVIPSSTPGQRSVVIKQPIGVVGIICPWNFPLAMAARKVGPALAAGCTVVVKAPAETPFTMLAFAALVERAGFPPGVFNVLTTDKATPQIGKELCENSDIRKVSFTGSTGVGKLLMGQSASTLKKLSFELGGNSPFIVFDDADLDAAVAGAVSCKFRGSGQTCVCANRIYVQSGVYDEFASRLTSAVSEFKLGNGFDPATTHGPIIHSRQLERVSSHVLAATKAGAQVLIGGKKREGKGWFYEPTVLSEVPVGVIDQEETFGPVAALYKFKTEEEVVRLANDADVGLAGYFFSQNVGRCWRIAEALEVGMVGVNTGMLSSPYIPFGGIKQSGFGREGGKYGIEEYLNIKYIAMGGL